MINMIVIMFVILLEFPTLPFELHVISLKEEKRAVLTANYYAFSNCVFPISFLYYFRFLITVTQSSRNYFVGVFVFVSYKI